MTYAQELNAHIAHVVENYPGDQFALTDAGLQAQARVIDPDANVRYRNINGDECFVIYFADQSQMTFDVCD